MSCIIELVFALTNPLWASTEYLAPVAPVGGFLYSPVRLPRYCEGKHKKFLRGHTRPEPSALKNFSRVDGPRVNPPF